MAPKTEAVVPAEIVERLLAAAGDDLILIGGQALKLWMDHYGIELPAKIPYVSRDVDFLAPSAADAEAVRRLARALGGRAIFPRRRGALTALVGQAVKEISHDEVLNVDIVHQVYGADADVGRRAVEVRLPELTLRVLHPLDVLKSRLDNLAGLKEKQNELGKAQLRAAMEVARAFLLDPEAGTKSPRSSRPAALRYVRFIEKMAESTAGKKAASRFAIHVADAIEPGAVRSREFREQKLPRLARLMSVERRRTLGL